MLRESDYVKIQIAVPVKDADALREVLGKAGAGEMGEYTHCSGSWASIGRFIPSDKANPTIGRAGKLEEVREEIIQTICHKDSIEKVIQAVKDAHPYEEPPIDIIPRLEV